ncbi:hypothetical protein BUALT_Bualt15G0093700 [Buddleja alternifolia]|uniref:Uncharacterized protein n=1 Tax=Buddleja alternifolia TaxID=168488 RepID=A0AAV6WC73_9LAMI|nr:hypothetical protein BUALT_Bualt15G0093700 [Buddleja alternifolia]
MSRSNSSSSCSSQWRRSQTVSSNSAPRPTYGCGFELPVLTSWTNLNPGRRFRMCPNYGRQIGVSAIGLRVCVVYYGWLGVVSFGVVMVWRHLGQAVRQTLGHFQKKTWLSCRLVLKRKLKWTETTLSDGTWGARGLEALTGLTTLFGSTIAGVDTNLDVEAATFAGLAAMFGCIGSFLDAMEADLD